MTNINLATLNALRAENGKAPLKNWKESKAKLEAAILNEQRPIAAKSIDHAKMEEQKTARLRQEALEQTAKAAREQREADAKALLEAEAKLPKPAAVKNTKPVDMKALQEALAKTTKTATKLPPAGVSPKAVKKITVAKPDKPDKPAAGSNSSEASIAAERLGVTAKAVRAKLRKLGHSAGHGLSADQIVKAVKA